MIGGLVELVRLSIGMVFSLMYVCIFWVAAAYWLPPLAPHSGQHEINAVRILMFMLGPIYMWGPGRDLMGCERFVKFMNVAILVTIGSYLWATAGTQVPA